jgi:hypothetical protein
MLLATKARIPPLRYHTLRVGSESCSQILDRSMTNTLAYFGLSLTKRIIALTSEMERDSQSFIWDWAIKNRTVCLSPSFASNFV